MVRLTADMVGAIDAYILGAEGRGERITRPDVVRSGIAEKLRRDGYLT